MARPSDLQNQLSSILWTNGQRLVTGATILAILTTIFFVLTGMGTWVYAVNQQAILAGLGFAPAPHVQGNADLAGVVPGIFPGAIVRDAFANAGDGGGATYTYSSTPCSLKAGVGDGGAQVKAGTGCWNTDVSQPISAAVWGVKSDSPVDGTGTDDQPAWTAAVKALATLNNGGTLLVPTHAGGTCSKLGSPLTIFGNNISIQGQSPLATCFDIAFAAGNGIEIGGNPTNNGPGATTLYSPFFDSVERVAFRHSVVHTSGADVSVYNAHYTKVSYVQCKGNGAMPSGPRYYRCVDVDGGPNDPRAAGTLDTYFEYLSTSGYGQTGICVGCNGAYSSPISTDIRWGELDNNLGAALEVQNSGSIYITTMNTDFNYIGAWIHPKAGQHANGMYWTNVNLDANGAYGLFIDTSAGGVSTGHKMTNFWAVNCGQVLPSQVPGAGPSPCIVMTAGTTNPVYNATSNPNAGSIANNEIIGMHSFETKMNCILMDAAVVDLRMSGQVSSCSLGNYNVNDAIRIVGAQHVSYDGEIGNNSLELANTGILPQYQRYGVSIEGASDYIKLSGDFSRNASGPVINTATGTNMLFEGIFPALTWVPYAVTLSCGAGSLTSASATGAYSIRGKTASLRVIATITNPGTCRTALLMSSPPAVALPLSGTGPTLVGRDRGGSGASVSSTLLGGGGNIAINRYDNVMPTLSSSSIFELEQTYQVN